MAHTIRKIVFNIYNTLPIHFI